MSQGGDEGMDARELDLSCAEWRKSSRSAGSGACVELACGLRGVVAVRDSKDAGGPSLVVAPDAWRLLTAAVKAGECYLA